MADDETTGTDVDVPVKAMSKKDQAALRSIVRNDFKLLRSELSQREMEVTNQLRQELAQSGKEELSEIAEGFQRIKEQFGPLDEELAEFQAQQARELRAFREQQEVRRTAIQTAMENYIAEAKERGFEPRYGGYNRHTPLDLQEWQVRGLNDRINQAIRNVQVQRGQAELALKRQEHTLIRDLTVGSLESDEAQTFLGQIPTLEQLIPAPNVQEIVAAEPTNK